MLSAYDARVLTADFERNGGQHYPEVLERLKVGNYRRAQLEALGPADDAWRTYLTERIEADAPDWRYRTPIM